MSRSDAERKPSPLLFICLFVLLGYFGVSVIQTMTEGHSHQDRLSEMENQIAQLQERKKSLEAELEKVQSDQFVETEARNKLHLARENETVVIFPQKSAVLAATKDSHYRPDSVVGRDFGYLDHWKELFFK